MPTKPHKNLLDNEFWQEQGIEAFWHFFAKLFGPLGCFFVVGVLVGIGLLAIVLISMSDDLVRLWTPTVKIIIFIVAMTIGIGAVVFSIVRRR